MSLLAHLETYRTGPANEILIAENSVWTKGWRMPFPGVLPDHDKIAAWLDSRSSNIAFEVYFPTLGGPLYLGWRYHPGAMAHLSTVQFLTVLFDAVAAHEDKPEAIVSASNAAFDVGACFTSSAATADLGIVDHWQEVGDLTIWRRGDPQVSDVARLIASRPDLTLSSLNVQALELNYDAPIGHWAALTIGKRIGHSWHLNSEILPTLLASFIAHQDAGSTP